MAQELLEQTFYFGFLSREQVAVYLERTGDWCLRRIGDESLVVTARTAMGTLLEFKLVQASVGWTLADRDGNHNIHQPSQSYSSPLELLLSRDRMLSELMLLSAVRRPSLLLRDDGLEMTTKILGEGHYAIVFKAYFTQNGERNGVAVKMCRNEEEILQGVSGDKQRHRAIRKAKLARSQMIDEARIVQRFCHDNVYKVLGIMCDTAPLKVIMEFCPGGSLRALLLEKKEQIDIPERNIFVFEAAKGLRHLQIKRFVHRDIAARNCLIGQNGMLKISDFGLCRSVAELKKRKIDEDGTAWPIPWMAPETLSKRPKFSTKSDVYSFGILMFEVFSAGEKPWASIIDAAEVIRIVREGERPDTPPSMPEAESSIMRECWRHKAKDRPDFIEIVPRLCQILKKCPLPSREKRVLSSICGVHWEKNRIVLEDESNELNDIASYQQNQEVDPPSQPKRGKRDDISSVSRSPKQLRRIPKEHRASLPISRVRLLRSESKDLSSSQPRVQKRTSASAPQFTVQKRLRRKKKAQSAVTSSMRPKRE